MQTVMQARRPRNSAATTLSTNNGAVANMDPRTAARVRLQRGFFAQHLRSTPRAVHTRCVHSLTDAAQMEMLEQAIAKVSDKFGKGSIMRHSDKPLESM
jgi:hypothetical protein